MIKRFRFLLLKGDFHANPSIYFIQCTGMNLYSLTLSQNCRVLQYLFVTNGLKEKQLNCLFLLQVSSAVSRNYKTRETRPSFSRNTENCLVASFAKFRETEFRQKPQSGQVLYEGLICYTVQKLKCQFPWQIF